MKASFFILTTLTLFTIATTAIAQPALQVNLMAEREVVTTVDGQEVLQRIPADEIASGQTIIYSLEVTNSGDQAATGVKVNDPIPPETAFIVGSTFGDDADITFSIDGGQSYAKPTLLSYRLQLPDGSFENRVATPNQYTHIQWQIDIVPAGGSRTVGFRAKVK